jgi:hypothetical protein
MPARWPKFLSSNKRLASAPSSMQSWISKSTSPMRSSNRIAHCSGSHLRGVQIRTSVSFVQIRLQLENDGTSECNISCGGREIREVSGCCCGSRHARRNFLKGAKECGRKPRECSFQIEWGASVLWRRQVRAVSRREQAADRPSGRRKRAYPTWHHERLRMMALTSPMSRLAQCKSAS